MREKYFKKDNARIVIDYCLKEKDHDTEIRVLGLLKIHFPIGCLVFIKEKGGEDLVSNLSGASSNAITTRELTQEETLAYKMLYPDFFY